MDTIQVQEMYIIKQLDDRKNVPVRYRGVDPTGEKPYGDLYYDMHDVIPFQYKERGEIIHLINTMRYTGKNVKGREDNAHKYFYILGVDVNHKVLSQRTYNQWLLHLRSLKKGN